MANFENKIIKQKKLGKELTLTVKQNEMSGRIFVEFSSDDGRLFVQKSFQDTAEGSEEASEFQKSMRSIKDLRKYLGIKELRPIIIKEVTQLNLGEKNVTSKRTRRN